MADRGKENNAKGMMMSQVKFNRFHVRNVETGEKVRVYYSLDNRCDGRKCVTLYARCILEGDALRPMFGDAYKNDTDSGTDYFDNGRAVLFEDHPHYAAARRMAEYIAELREDAVTAR